jgi:hypothetical protein
MHAGLFFNKERGYWFFPKLKLKLNERHFETVSDIAKKSQVVLDSINKNDFHGAFEVWKKMMGSLYTFPRRLF